ncbi:hypothetical protein D3C86_1928810 [compost metagenome]
MDDGEDAGDIGQVEKGADGAGQDRYASERAILLGVGGAIGAGAFALPGGDDDDGNGLLTHGNLDLKPSHARGLAPAMACGKCRAAAPWQAAFKVLRCQSF